MTAKFTARLALGTALVLSAAITGFSPLVAAQGKVAMLLPGSINDQSWNANGYGAVVTL